MNTTARVRATQDYFRTVLACSPDLLSPLFQRAVPAGIDVRVTEQIIQDYLTMVFQPFAGRFRVPAYFQAEAPRSIKDLQIAADAVLKARVRFGLVGAHYRSALSAKGRRSAFAINRPRLVATLRRLLGDRPCGDCWEDAGCRRVLETLWEAVYLEQYFGLFNRKLTLGEWALDQRKKIPLLILAEGSIGEPALERFRNVREFKQIIVLPKRLTDALLSEDLLRSFAKAVAHGIAGAIAEKKKDGVLRRLARQFDGHPESAGLGSWNELVRSANALARESVLQQAVDQELELRNAYVKGMLLYDAEQSEVRRRLLLRLPAAEEAAEEERLPKEMSQLSRLLGVYQSLQFYTRRYGENCATVPYESGHPTTSGEGFQSSITLFWDGGRNLDVLYAMAAGARGVFGQLNPLLDSLPRHHRHGLPPFETEDVDAVDRIRRDSKGRLSGIEIHALLKAARDLSRALHEGKPRSFSFILGSPEWLISDLSVVHDLMGSSRRYLSAEGRERPFSYQRMLAFLRGNSAFFQDDSVALFLPYPGLPLEVTHIVKIGKEGVGRRHLLSSFSKGKPVVVTVATYGSGAGEVIYNGEVTAILSPAGEWVHTGGYQSLIEQLQVEIGRLADEGVAQKVVVRLEPCLRRISEEPGVGGLFVIARERKAGELKDSSIALTEVIEAIDGRSLQELNSRDVYDLARDDGATIIEVPSLRVWGRRLLAAGPRPRDKKPPTDKPSGAIERMPPLEWGTRRWTAQRVSQGLGAEGLVVVVSADGPISVLQSGEVTVQFGEPDTFPRRGFAPAPRPASPHSR